jgi:hypothetical protein
MSRFRIEIFSRCLTDFTTESRRARTGATSERGHWTWYATASAVRNSFPGIPAYSAASTAPRLSLGWHVSRFAR